MLDFCPLCHKNGFKKKIILQQINLQEAVWLCEYSECPWPFGYQDFTFVSRRIGETSSSEWELRKPVTLKTSESFPISLAELGLDTPPVTPGSGNEVVHKDSVYGDSTCSVTSINLSTNNVVQTEVNLGLSKSSSNKLRQSYASVPNIKNNDQDSKDKKLFNHVNHRLNDRETQSESKGDFSLSDDVNLENLDKCLFSSQGFIDACDNAEALTESVFNVGKPSKDNLTIHESTVKCKKWLSDNTKREHSYSFPESKRVAIESRNALLKELDSRLQSDGADNFNIRKELPKVKSIEKTNVKLARVITASNQTDLTDKKNSASVTVEKSSLVVVGNLTPFAKAETQQKITGTNASHCITVGDNSAPQSYAVCESSSENCKVGNTTVTIDGLIPINISIEVPNFVEEYMPVPWSTNSEVKVNEENGKLDLRQEPVVNDSVVSIGKKVGAVNCLETKSSLPVISGRSETRRQSVKKPLKRTIPKLAKYQGFNFGALNKKSKTNASRSEENIKSSLPNLPSPDNISSSSDLTWTSEMSCTTTITVNSKSESVDPNIDSNSKSTLSVDNNILATSSSDLYTNNTFTSDNNGILESDFDQILNELFGENQDVK